MVVEGLMPEWLEVFRELQRRDGWRPVYWVMEAEHRPAVCESFPGVVFHDNMAAARGIPAPEMADLTPLPVDQALLSGLAFHQAIALWMMDRMDPGHCFSLAERMRHWRRLLAYWGGVLRRLRPDLVVFPESPHAVYDYAIYALCAHWGLRMVHFHKAPPLRLVFPLERFEYEYPTVAAAYAQALARPDSAGLSEDAERELIRITQPAQASQPYWVQWQFNKVQPRPPWWRQGLGYLRHPGRLVDLATIDILRDRERGVPRYNEFRRLVHKPPVKSFEELTNNPDWAEEMRRVYDNDIDLVDLMVGLYAEPTPPGFGFSDTAFRIFILMASRRLKSDRFFTTDYSPNIYTPVGMAWIADNTMSSVLLRHFPGLETQLQSVANAFAPWPMAKS